MNKIVKNSSKIIISGLLIFFFISSNKVIPPFISNHIHLNYPTFWQ